MKMVHKRSQNKLQERKIKSFLSNKRKREKVNSLNETIENKDKVLLQLQEELQQQQQLINNLEKIEVSQEQHIEDLERQNSRIRARSSMISQEITRNLQRTFGAEGHIKDLNSQIRSLKYQINSHNCNDVLNKNKNI
ncbi:hypothetical protein RclHR1_25240002 [Rhizophagus clarus]|uniref:Uncharacterized protein n=1 Tax=Rhizophagus clarus TaxID=94130 RepID=A0A2Z6R3K2_9GLOM|nr:hypothetical protein RclHR1_25240002 [Rhizophagus clarus]